MIPLELLFIINKYTFGDIALIQSLFKIFGFHVSIKYLYTITWKYLPVPYSKHFFNTFGLKTITGVDVVWKLNDKKHRIGAPAMIENRIYHRWYLFDKLQREDLLF